MECNGNGEGDYTLKKLSLCNYLIYSTSYRFLPCSMTETAVEMLLENSKFLSKERPVSVVLMIRNYLNMEFIIVLLCFFKGIILEYIQSGELKTKSIDLLDLNTA